MKCPTAKLTRLILSLLLGALPIKGLAQWLTQTNNLAPGWNAVYLNVDASYDTIDRLVGGDPANPIQEIWMWFPAPGTGQYITDPSSPYSAGTQWVQWLRSSVNIGVNPLNSLRANQAFLVRTTNAYAWKVKGQPVLPAYKWNSSGENFIGFPANPSVPPTFDQYLSRAPLFEATAQVFRYPGGNLGATNPVQVGSFASVPLVRGQAYWVRSANFNNYYAPFTASGLAGGLAFGASGGQSKITLANNTAQALTVYLNLLASEASPTNQAPIRSTPPLLLRGAVNPTDLTYSSSVLNGVANLPVTLQPAGLPGSSVEVVVGLNRSAISNANPGDAIAGILRLTDSLGLAQIDVPVSATVAPASGLWVGSASVNAVNQYLNTYYTANSLLELTNTLNALNIANGADGVTYQIDAASGRIIGLSSGNGVFLSTLTTVTNSGVPKPFDLRLIMHMGLNSALGTQRATLLQHAYIGKDLSGKMVVTTTTNQLDPAQLASARRISAIQFPWQGDSKNSGWAAVEAPSANPSTFTFTVPIDYNDQASNPFVHNYHPDHDNLDANFLPLANGSESFTILRTIRLFFTAPGTDFASLTGAAGHLQGNYSETISVTDGLTKQRNFDVSGVFSLNQIVTNNSLGYITSGATAQDLHFSQSLDFPALPNLPYTPVPYALSASASSGLPVSFSVANGPGTISGSSLTTTGLGAVTVVASQAGAGNVAAALPVQRTFTIVPGLNVITFSSIPPTNYITGTISLSATASSGLPVTFSVVSGPGSVSGNKLSLNSVGTVVVAASQPGNSLYRAAVSVTNSFTVGQAAQSISFAALPNISYTPGAISLSASASSGLPITFSVNSGPATITGNSLSLTGVGTVTVVARQTGNLNYLAATPVTNSFTVSKAAETIAFTAIPNTTFSTNPITLSATASSGLPVSFSIAGGLATLSGNAVVLSGVGVVSVVASQAGNANYNAATPVTNSFAVGKASQSISLVALEASGLVGEYFASQAGTTNGTASLVRVDAYADYDWSASFPDASIGHDNYTVRWTGHLLSPTNGNVNFRTVGDDGVRLNVAGVQLVNNWVIQPPNGTVASTNLFLGQFYPFEFDYFQQGGGAVASLQWNGPGYGQFVKDATYSAIPPEYLFHPVANAVYAPTNSYALNAPASSGLPVTYAISSGPAAVSGGRITVTGAGTVNYTINQAGNSNYLAAPAYSGSFTVSKADQIITFPAIPAMTYLGNAASLTATSSSGLAVTYTVLSGPASVSGSTLTSSGAGLVTVVASQAGNGNYNAATPVTNTVTVAKASQTIAFGALSAATYAPNGTITLSASASSSLAISYSVSGPATVSGNILTMTGAGQVTVTASQAGDSNYNAATSVSNTLNIGKASQTITFNALAGVTYAPNATVTLGATASSSLAISYSVSGPATVSGNILTITGVGQVTVTASQGGDSNYNAATSVNNTFTVSKASQTTTFNALADTTYAPNATLTLGATASSSLGVTYSVSGPASISGNILTITGAGTVSVVASQSGNANYLAATDVTRTFTVNKASQTIAFTAPAAQTWPVSTISLSASATSGGTVTFGVTSGPATVSGSTLTVTGAGTVTVSASQSGTANYSAATSVSQSFVVNKGSQTITFSQPANGKFAQTIGTVSPKYTYTYTLTLAATSSASLTCTYSVTGTGATLAGNVLTVKSTSTTALSTLTVPVTVTVSQAGDGNYNAATAVSRTWNVVYP